MEAVTHLVARWTFLSNKKMGGSHVEIFMQLGREWFLVARWPSPSNKRLGGSRIENVPCVPFFVFRCDSGREQVQIGEGGKSRSSFYWQLKSDWKSGKEGIRVCIYGHKFNQMASNITFACTVIWEIFALKIFMCKIFVLKIFYTLQRFNSHSITYDIGVLKIFCAFNFSTLWWVEKSFSCEIFLNYSILIYFIVRYLYSRKKSLIRWTLLTI